MEKFESEIVRLLADWVDMLFTVRLDILTCEEQPFYITRVCFTLRNSFGQGI